MAVVTEFAIKVEKTKNKEYTLKDESGLFLNIHPSGSKYWLFRFSWNGKQSRLSFGTYPTVNIEKARSLYKQANCKLFSGIHPRLQESLDSKPLQKLQLI